MKSLRHLVLPALFASFALVACDKRQTQEVPPPPPAQPDEAEVERRVQQRLTEERLAEEQRRAREREQELNDRERTLSERERELRDQQSTPQQPAREPVTERVERAERTVEVADSYQIFYDALAPYGAWLEVNNYGYVWQPRVAVENWRWRPYTDGRWAYTDQGWTWLSNERFGWAVYHYGRWTRLRRLGWVWVPGEQWAPAWVAWRYSDRFVGWAPLPPEARFDGAGGIREWADQRYEIAASDYVFVPASEFGEERVEHVIVPSEQNVTIVNETTNVTNIVQNNLVVMNYGPRIELVQQRSRRPIARLRVERRAASTRGGDQNASVVKGQTVEFSAPVIRRSNAAAKPVQVKERVTDTKADQSAQPAQQTSPGRAARQPSPTNTPPPQLADTPVPSPSPQPKQAAQPTEPSPSPRQPRPRRGQTPAPTPQSVITPTITPAPAEPPQSSIPPVTSPSNPAGPVSLPNSPSPARPTPAADRRAAIEERRRALEERQAAADRARQQAEEQRRQRQLQIQAERERERQEQSQRRAASPQPTQLIQPTSPDQPAALTLPLTPPVPQDNAPIPPAQQTPPPISRPRVRPPAPDTPQERPVQQLTPKRPQPATPPERRANPSPRSKSAASPSPRPSP